MNRKNTEQTRSKIRLAVTKETLKDLSTKQTIRGGARVHGDPVGTRPSIN